MHLTVVHFPSFFSLVLFALHIHWPRVLHVEIENKLILCSVFVQSVGVCWCCCDMSFHFCSLFYGFCICEPQRAQTKRWENETTATAFSSYYFPLRKFLFAASSSYALYRPTHSTAASDDYVPLNLILYKIATTTTTTIPATKKTVCESVSNCKLFLLLFACNCEFLLFYKLRGNKMFCIFKWFLFKLMMKESTHGQGHASMS